jgi:hypothetical protein
MTDCHITVNKSYQCTAFDRNVSKRESYKNDTEMALENSNKKIKQSHLREILHLLMQSGIHKE